MYKVSLFNNGLETVIHFPSSDPNDPHLSKLSLKEGLSIVDSLSFSLYKNSNGYNNVQELITKIKITDLRDNTIRFTGRVYNIKEKMDSDGKIYKDITCEGALSYLNDTKQRGSSLYSDTVAGFLNQILSIHNSKVESAKQIQVGNVNIAGNVIHTCEYKTTLAEILEVKDKIGGDIHLREYNNTLYLDWLSDYNTATLEIRLGVNMKDMIVEKDISSIGTRIVPLGANNLTIENANGGLDYIEDANARNIYGVIEKTVEYKDIKDAAELRNACLTDISNHTQAVYKLESSALDLSYLSGNKVEQFHLGTKLRIINPIMNIDAIYSVIQMDLDLLTPYDPKLTISNSPVTLTSTINDLRKTSVQNNGVYNNVQIGSAYGIRAVRSDNKVVTTINATDGITIENNNKKVFSVDTNGNIITNDITANDMKANRGTFTDIYAEGGTFNKITATSGLTIEDSDSSCLINVNGLTLNNGNYQTSIKVDDSKSALKVNDDLVVGKGVFATGISYFNDNVEIDGLLMVGGHSLRTIIEDIVEEMVKPESLN